MMIHVAQQIDAQCRTRECQRNAYFLQEVEPIGGLLLTVHPTRRIVYRFPTFAPMLFLSFPRVFLRLPIEFYRKTSDNAWNT